MLDEAVLITETGGAYRARFRMGTAADRRALVGSWLPMLARGPAHWLDREWPWDTFGADELHGDLNPEWLVLADELEQGASGELFGVLVTTGPMSARHAGIEHLLAVDGGFFWVEYIAVAPSLRKNCPLPLRRRPWLRVVGPSLMKAAIARSKALGMEGRLGLHAEGELARLTYGAENWNMDYLGEAAHRAGDAYPVYFGDAAWAVEFCAERTPEEGGRR
jgi:hypothetical protein